MPMQYGVAKTGTYEVQDAQLLLANWVACLARRHGPGPRMGRYPDAIPNSST
jgi:hypothetical protein